MKFFYVIAFLFTCSFARAEGIDNIPTQLKDEYSHNYQEWLARMEGLQSSLNGDRIKWISVNDQFYEMRLAYKRIEVYTDFYEAKFMNSQIDGLLSNQYIIPRKSSEAGIQLVEKAIVDKDSTNLKKHFSALKKNADQLATLMANKNYDQSEIFAALREELVRIASIGISGFGCLNSEHILNESKEALASVHGIISHYYPHIKQEHTIGFETEIIQGYTFFSGTDFDSFDRFGFIRKCIQPLYDRILKVQQELKIDINASKGRIDNSTSTIFTNEFIRKQPTSSEKDKIELGKLLFYDPILNRDAKTACATCHDPKQAFGLENSTALTNEFWGDNNYVMPLLDHGSSGMNHEEILQRLKTCDEYIAKFKKAYPEAKPAMNMNTISWALMDYISSLYSFESSFDKYLTRGENENNFEDVKGGFNVFMGKGKCAQCHIPPSFSGLRGPRFNSTFLLKKDKNIVHVPSVRNVYVSYPYFRKDPVNTLEEMLDAHEEGKHGKITVEAAGLTKDEKASLVSFMASLTYLSPEMRDIPTSLPESTIGDLKGRNVGGKP